MPTDLAAATGNLAALLTYLTEAEIGETRDTAAGLWYRSGAPDPWFNGVVQEQPGQAQVVEELCRPFVDASVPFSWWVASDAPAAATATPAARGFQAADSYTVAKLVATSAMSFQTERVGEDRDIVVERAGGLPPMEQYIRVLRQGSGLSATRAKTWFGVFSRAGFEPNATLRHYVGLRDGLPVAVASLYLNLGVAGIYHLAHMPSDGSVVDEVVVLGHVLDIARLDDAQPFAFLRSGQADELGIPAADVCGTITRYEYHGASSA